MISTLFIYLSIYLQVTKVDIFKQKVKIAKATSSKVKPI